MPPDYLRLAAKRKRFRLVGVRTQDNAEQFAVATAEAILRSGDDVIRLELTPSADTPNFVEAKPVALPLGTYDVELHVQLKSGIRLQLSLRHYIKSVLRDEAILISLPQASADESLVSSSQSHLDFGLLGDVTSERSLEIILQSDQFDGPVAITLDSQLTDSEGNAPVEPWLSFSRKNITLFPGRPERVRIKAIVPDEVAATIVDGPMEGLVRILAAGRDVELPIKRAEKIAGVAEDAIVNRVTFELKRPQIGVAIPWAMGNWVRGSDDNVHGVVRVDVSRTFSRMVTIEVSHDSAVARSLTVLPQGTIVDRDGRSVPTLRLVPAEGLELTQSIESGQHGIWTFLFNIDEDCDVPLGIATLELAGPGLQPLRLPIEIQIRKPLLAAKLVRLSWIGFCISMLISVLILRRFLRFRRLKTDAEPLVTRYSGLPDVFRLESLAQGKEAIVPHVAMEVVTGEELMRPRVLHPEQPFVLRTDEISEGTPLELKIIEGDSDAVVRITGIDLDENDDPEVQVHVIDGGQFDVKCTRLKRAFAVNLLPQVACLLVATGMTDPIVVRRIQWIWDAICSA